MPDSTGDRNRAGNQVNGRNQMTVKTSGEENVRLSAMENRMNGGVACKAGPGY